MIDYRDHRDFDDPLAFLRLTEDAWARCLAARPDFDYTNRWRHEQFRRAFEAAGLVAEQVTCTRTAVDEAARARFASPFRELALDELQIVGGQFLVGKPAP